ncbi:MAG: NADH-quinone oxidoreductase subunit N [Actinobacteria bacterium]|nr:MAG: NADH-quinone oxidoreductase subunit N [Actinomycetota bacterium]
MWRWPRYSGADLTRSLIAWLPEVLLILTALGLASADVVGGAVRRRIRTFAVGGLLAAVAAAVYLAANRAAFYGTYFGGTLRFDDMTSFGRVLFCTAGALVVMASWEFYEDESRLEYFTLFVMSLLGEVIVVGGQTMLMLFIGIELLALPTYALTAIIRRQQAAVEAGLKYFMLGMLASIVMLYGMSLLYGSFGTISYARPLFSGGTQMPGRADVVLFAFFLLFMGLGFKIVAFPFHFWSPDVYAGGSTPVVAYIATVPKVAIVLAIFRILGPTYAAGYPTIRLYIGLLALLSMTFGNLVALQQSDVRRMLAYSGISNTGYALVGLVAGGEAAFGALLFFLTVYTFANLGAFFVILGVSGQESTLMDEFNGLAKRSPLLAASMAIFLFSLGGTPPLAGFFGKFVLFKSAVDGGLAYLAAAGLINTVVAVGYYLRITQRMYALPPTSPEARMPRPRGMLAVALTLVLAATLLLGVFGIPWFARVV